jgi:hypothetical protein
MDEEHAQQRAEVKRLAAVDATAPLRSGSPRFSRSRRLCSRIMADEEKTCLSPEVLRDDVIAVQADGE